MYGIFVYVRVFVFSLSLFLLNLSYGIGRGQAGHESSGWMEKDEGGHNEPNGNVCVHFNSFSSFFLLT